MNGQEPSLSLPRRKGKPDHVQLSKGGLSLQARQVPESTTGLNSFPTDRVPLQFATKTATEAEQRRRSKTSNLGLPSEASFSGGGAVKGNGLANH